MKFEKLNFLVTLITFIIVGLTIINGYYSIGTMLLYIFGILLIGVRVKYFGFPENWPHREYYILGIIEAFLPVFILTIIGYESKYSIRTRYIVFIVYMVFYILKYYFLKYLEKKEKNPFI